MEPGAQYELLMIAVRAAALPFAVALAGLCVAQSRRPGPVVLAVVLAELAGLAAMNHAQWRFPPAQVMDWLPLLAGGTALWLAAAERFGGQRIRLAALSAAAGGATWALLPPALTGAAFAAWWVGASAAMVALWHGLDGERAPRTSAIGLMLCCGALAVVVGLGGSILIGCAAASVAGALAAWALLGAAGGWLPFPRALLGSLTLTFCGLVLISYFYAEISPFALGGVLLGLFSVRLAPEEEAGRRWRALALCAAGGALALTAPVGFTLWRFMQQPAY